MDRDFIDFKFGDHWASEFNLLAVSSGDRYSRPIYGNINANTSSIMGKTGVYKWKSQVGEKIFNFDIAFDNINGQTLNQIKQWLKPSKIEKLIFKEEPFKYYWVALSAEPDLKFVPFLEETRVVNGIEFKEGIYKGEFNIQFVCIDNYGYSDWQSFDENYDYQLKTVEIEGNTGTIKDAMNLEAAFEISGNSVQETSEMGINYLDASKFDNSNTYITKLEDGWYHVERTNTASATAYVNLPNPIEYNFLKENTNYTIMAEIRNVNIDNLNTSYLRVTGDASVFTTSMTINGTQLAQGNNKYTAQKTTISDFSSYTKDFTLATFVGIQAGETANFDFRISIYDANYEGDYVAFVPNKPSPLYSSQIRNCGDNINLLNIQDVEETTSTGGIVYSVQNGIFTLNGTSTGAHYIVFPTLNNFKKDTYTMSTKVLEGSYTGVVGKQINNSAGSAIVFNGGNISDTTTATISNDETGTKIALYVGGNAVFNNYKIKLKLEKGDKATGWSKHGCGSVDIKVQNKNLCTKTVLQNANNIQFHFDPQMISKTFSISFDINVPLDRNSLYLRIDGKDASQKLTAQITSSEGKVNKTVTFTDTVYNELKSGKTAYFLLYKDSAGFTLPTYSQIENNELTTDCVSRQEQIVSFPFKEGQVLHENDYLADDGIHHKRKTVVLDGTENWSFNSTYSSATINIKNLNMQTGSNADIISNRFKMADKSIEGINYISSTSIYVKIDGLTTLAEYKAKFAEWAEAGEAFCIEGNVIEEEIEAYTEEQQEAFKNIYLYEGINHITQLNSVPTEISVIYIPEQNIYIDYVVNNSNLLNDSSFYYDNNIYKKSYLDKETGDAEKSGISSNRPVYLYNAGTTDANLNLVFDLIVPAENEPLVIKVESCKLVNGGFMVLNNISSITINSFKYYQPFVDIFDGELDNWQIEIDSTLCEVYVKHKTDKSKVINLNKFNKDQSFLSLTDCNFVDYLKPFPTSIMTIKNTALENTIFNKVSIGASARNYRLKNVDVKWEHTYM